MVLDGWGLPLARLTQGKSSAESFFVLHFLDREAPLVILWVVGGVTAGEVALAKKAVAGTESKLTIGGSRVVSPKDALNLAFTHDCLA